jgi:hypothetical protein
VPCIGGMRIVIFYVASVFSESCCQISAGLTYVCFITGFKFQPVNFAFVVVLCDVKVFRPGLLVYFLVLFKCYLDVRMFEKVCDFPDFGTVICEGNHFCFGCCFCQLGIFLCVFYFK